MRFSSILRSQLNRTAHSSSELGTAAEASNRPRVVARRADGQYDTSGGARLQFAPFEPRPLLGASLILLAAWVVGALGREAGAGEGDLNSPSTNRYRVPGDGDAAVIPVVVGGQSRPFILDTGSRITVLDSSFRRLLGRPVGVRTGRLANGDIKLELFLAPPIRIRGVDTSAPEGIPKLVTVADLSMVREWTGHNIEGLLGMDVLQYMTLCIDPDERCVSFVDTVPKDAGVAIPLHYLAGKLPAIAVAAGGERVEALLDTGNLGPGEGELDGDTFARLARAGSISEERQVSFNTLAGESQARSGTLSDLSLKRFVHHNLYFDSSDVSSVGMLYLSRYIITFDFPRDTLYLKKSRTHAEPCRTDQSGMSFKRVGKRTVVDSVDPGSPAAAAGLQPGDVIVRIDAMDAASERLHSLRLALCTEGSVNVTVRRGTTEIPVRINLREHDKANRSDAPSRGRPSRSPR